MTLSDLQHRKLIPSLEQFQLGDGGGPAFLIAWNRERLFEQISAYRELITLWFKEEKEHSRLLSQAVDRVGGTPRQSHWSFEVFCAVRRFLGVQFELKALLMTEIVSHVYYKLLYRHCPDEPIRAMCRLIIRDESGHIRFHRDRVAILSGSGTGIWWEILLKIQGLLAGTMLWVNHRAALVAQGASTAEFYRGIWQDMNRFVRCVRFRRAESQVLPVKKRFPGQNPKRRAAMTGAA